MPDARTCAVVIGSPPGDGELSGGTTSQSLQPSASSAAASATEKVLAMAGFLEAVRSGACGCGRMAQNPTSTLKKKLRFGGYGARSTNRLTFWLPKLLTSGSMHQECGRIARFGPLRR